MIFVFEQHKTHFSLHFSAKISRHFYTFPRTPSKPFPNSHSFSNNSQKNRSADRQSDSLSGATFHLHFCKTAIRYLCFSCKCAGFVRSVSFLPYNHGEKGNNENTELFHFFCSLKEKAGNFPAKGGPGSDDQPVFLCILYANLMIKSSSFLSPNYHKPRRNASERIRKARSGVCRSARRLCKNYGFIKR